MCGESERYVMVEGPSWPDAEFYSKWLLAAAKAQALWQDAKKDPDFAKRVDCVSAIYIPDFGITASVLLSRLIDSGFSLIVDLYGEDLEVEVFSMMIGMGFFARTGQHYKMVIPTRLTTGVVKSAARQFVETLDGDFYFHPEHLLTTMSLEQAKEWQTRLENMNTGDRCADRIVRRADEGDPMPLACSHRTQRWQIGDAHKLSISRKGGFHG